MFVVSTGCSKKSENSIQPVTSTTWTISGSTYKGSYTSFTQGELLSMDNDIITLPQIYILFNNETPAAGNYTVVNTLTVNSLSAGQCYLETNDSGHNMLYSNGGSVKVTLNNGKVTASFNNVPMVTQTGIDGSGNPTFTSSGTTSGTLIQQ